jgi:hypothetical protein
MRFAFLTALTALIFIGTGCEGVLDGPRDPAIVPTGGGTANTGGGSATGGGFVEPPCTPGTATVTKLNRVSNHEYQQIISDVLGVPVPDSYFTRWTPIASVYGFDTMSESRIDGQGLTTQLETAERLVELIRTTPALTAHCPAPAQPHLGGSGFAMQAQEGGLGPLRVRPGTLVDHRASQRLVAGQVVDVPGRPGKIRQVSEAVFWGA